MFEFPSAPTVGQVSNGYSWDGEKWKGGQPSGPQKETFIDYSGKSTVDVAVPTWAKSARITAHIMPASTAAMSLGLQVSGDGSTFGTAATNYNYAGAMHDTGTNNYFKQATIQGASLPLTPAGDVATVAHITTTEFELVRPSTSFGFTIKSYGTSYNASAAALVRTIWLYGWVDPALTTSLTIKALRFVGATGAAGSHIHIQWLGDDAQIPINNAIAAPPSDGNEYTMVNGVWRLKAQTFNLAGISNFVIQVPTWGPKRARINGSAAPATATLIQTLVRLSGDGTTWPVAASDYGYSGFVHYGGTQSIAWVPTSTITGMPIAWNSDNVNVPMLFDATVSLWRNSTSGNYYCQSRSAGYVVSGGTTLLNQNAVMSCYLGGANCGSFLTIKAIQITNQPNTVNWAANSTLSVEWLA